MVVWGMNFRVTTSRVVYLVCDLEQVTYFTFLYYSF